MTIIQAEAGESRIIMIFALTALIMEYNGRRRYLQRNWLRMQEEGNLIPKQSYDIVMQTSIGKRYGTMTVEWEGEQISGLMEILGHTEA